MVEKQQREYRQCKPTCSSTVFGSWGRGRYDEIEGAKFIRDWLRGTGMFDKRTIKKYPHDNVPRNEPIEWGLFMVKKKGMHIPKDKWVRRIVKLITDAFGFE